MTVRVGAIAVVALALLALALAQPRVTPLWSLYVGDRVANREVLFLEPFPSAGSCGAAARALGTTGQWTSCRGRLTLSLRQSVRLVTLQQEFVPGGAWERLEALCGLRGEPDDARRLRARVRGGSAPYSSDVPS
jgi:hypothetical protein